MPMGRGGDEVSRPEWMAENPNDPRGAGYESVYDDGFEDGCIAQARELLRWIDKHIWPADPTDRSPGGWLLLESAFWKRINREVMGE